MNAKISTIELLQKYGTINANNFSIQEIYELLAERDRLRAEVKELRGISARQNTIIARARVYAQTQADYDSDEAALWAQILEILNTPPVAQAALAKSENGKA